MTINTLLQRFPGNFTANGMGKISGKGMPFPYRHCHSKAGILPLPAILLTGSDQIVSAAAMLVQVLPCQNTSTGQALSSSLIFRILLRTLTG